MNGESKKQKAENQRLARERQAAADHRKIRERIRNHAPPREIFPRNEELLTRKEIGQRLKLSERTIARWMRENDVPHHRFGPKVVRFRWSEVEKFFVEKERASRERAAARERATGKWCRGARQTG